MSTERAMAGMEAEKESSDLDGKYLTFWTEKQLFGIPIADVVQIVQMQPITEIPEFPSYAKGIINLRGTMIPCIDVSLRLGKMVAPYDDHTCIIVTNIRDRVIGLIVEGVEEVTDILDEEISPPPAMSSDYVNTYLTGIGKHNGKVILLLDAQKILGADQLALL